jgi:hypothetical protein
MVVDLYLVFSFIKRLVTPFKKWPAYKEGIIDEKGNILISRKKLTRNKQKKAFGLFDQLILNLKKLLAKLPGGSTRIASYAAALWLIRENERLDKLGSLLTESEEYDIIDESLANFLEEHKDILYEDACPTAAGDVDLNTKNRDATIKKHNYGPLNVDVPGPYWEKIADHWDTTVEAAKKSLCENCVAFDVSPRMKDCMPGDTSDDDGELGYCWMHHFKCHSARTCNTWAKGGPISNDETSRDWQSRNEGVIEEIPTVNVGGGAIAGLGVGPQGEPGVSPRAQKKYKKKNMKQLLQDIQEK